VYWFAAMPRIKPVRGERTDRDSRAGNRRI
jgi:hypothetical protein